MVQRSLVLYTCFILLLGLNQLCLAVSIQGYEPTGDDGWLRLHPTPATWLEARMRCEIEGGTLASPTSNALATSMKSKMAAMDSVFTGKRASATGDIDGIPTNTPPPALYFLYLGMPFSSVEPNSLGDDEDCQAMNGEGELADVSCAGKLRFFCYKSKAAMAESVCGTNNGYTLEPRTGSCYNFHSHSLPWHRANMHCNAEGAHLAVINSETEAQVFKELFAQYPSYAISGIYKDAAHIGFLDWNRRGNWLTIFGKTLAEAGYSHWDYGEPNNETPHNEYCGSVMRNGRLNDVPCFETDNPYICEKTPKNINS